MKRNPSLDKIKLDVDALPVVTEGLKTAGQLFELIKASLPSEQEKLIRLGLKQAALIARNKKKATKEEIREFMARIKAKRKALRIAKKLNLPLDNLRDDLLVLLNNLAD